MLPPPSVGGSMHGSSVWLSVAGSSDQCSFCYLLLDPRMGTRCSLRHLSVDSCTEAWYGWLLLDPVTDQSHVYRFLEPATYATSDIYRWTQQPMLPPPSVGGSMHGSSVWLSVAGSSDQCSFRHLLLDPRMGTRYSFLLLDPATDQSHFYRFLEPATYATSVIHCWTQQQMLPPPSVATDQSHFYRFLEPATYATSIIYRWTQQPMLPPPSVGGSMHGSSLSVAGPSDRPVAFLLVPEPSNLCSFRHLLLDLHKAQYGFLLLKQYLQKLPDDSLSDSNSSTTSSNISHASSDAEPIGNFLTTIFLTETALLPVLDRAAIIVQDYDLWKLNWGGISNWLLYTPGTDTNSNLLYQLDCHWQRGRDLIADISRLSSSKNCSSDPLLLQRVFRKLISISEVVHRPLKDQIHDSKRGIFHTLKVAREHNTAALNKQLEEAREATLLETAQNELIARAHQSIINIATVYYHLQIFNMAREPISRELLPKLRPHQSIINIATVYYHLQMSIKITTLKLLPKITASSIHHQYSICDCLLPPSDSAGLRVRFDSSSDSSLAYSHMVICVCSPSSSTQVTPRCRRWPMQRNSQRLPDSRVAFDKMPVEDRCWFGAFWKLGNHIVDEGADANFLANPKTDNNRGNHWAPPEFCHTHGQRANCAPHSARGPASWLMLTLLNFQASIKHTFKVLNENGIRAGGGHGPLTEKDVFADCKTLLIQLSTASNKLIVVVPAIGMGTLPYTVTGRTNTARTGRIFEGIRDGSVRPVKPYTGGLYRLIRTLLEQDQKAPRPQTNSPFSCCIHEPMKIVCVGYWIQQQKVHPAQAQLVSVDPATKYASGLHPWIQQQKDGVRNRRTELEA
ncbi:hypothetical protein GGX14DRAFT_609569 [Mycena pura]|uniref:Uncharacterized protein n=1 Tax=Mycena pura TaxID=153505 RepID=A0AAD6VMV5_9AGAR|nr:hypothetical protein GGX14DRAFT_609569 [Mycena pura]